MAIPAQIILSNFLCILPPPLPSTALTTASLTFRRDFISIDEQHVTFKMICAIPCIHHRETPGNFRCRSRSLISRQMLLFKWQLKQSCQRANRAINLKLKHNSHLSGWTELSWSRMQRSVGTQTAWASAPPIPEGTAMCMKLLTLWTVRTAFISFLTTCT